MALIKNFLKKDWRKLIIWGSFLIIGSYVFSLNSWQIDEKVICFFFFPIHILGTVTHPIFKLTHLVVGLFLTLIYWYILSCFFISLFDSAILRFKKPQKEKQYMSASFEKKISTQTAIIIIICIFIIAGIIIYWQFLEGAKLLESLYKMKAVNKFVFLNNDQSSFF